MIVRLTSHVFLLANVLCFLSCSSTEPTWVKSRPNDELYWHGVGFTSFDVSNNPNAKAKEHAIHEISSQIKVNISSEMDIIVKDSNGSVENTIKSVMQSRVNLLLPELEFPSIYKNKEGIFFYARLNKEKYRLALNRLRENAKQASLSYIIESEKDFGVNSFMLIQKAWQEIIPFNDEPIEVIYLNENVNLYTLIKRKLNQFEDRLLINADVEKNRMRIFVDRHNTVEINVRDKKNNKRLSSIPIKITYSGESQTLLTNSNGTIKHDLVLNSRLFSYDIKFQLDQDALFIHSENKDNYLPINPRLNSVKVQVVPSKVSIISMEKNINLLMNELVVEPAIKQYFNQKMEFVNDNPDMVIKIESNTTEKAKRIDENFPYFVYGNVSMSIFDATTEEEFFNMYLSNIKGGDFDSRHAAGIRAYENMLIELINKLDKASIFN
ncbi:MAG: hypothetical protein ACJZ12_03405 [Candidatus Neomarinimicrobiota bacterium]